MKGFEGQFFDFKVGLTLRVQSAERICGEREPNETRCHRTSMNPTIRKASFFREARMDRARGRLEICGQFECHRKCLG